MAFLVSGLSLVVVDDVYSFWSVCFYQECGLWLRVCCNLQDGSIMPVTGVICWYRYLLSLLPSPWAECALREHSGLRGPAAVLNPVLAMGSSSADSRNPHTLDWEINHSCCKQESYRDLESICYAVLFGKWD